MIGKQLGNYRIVRRLGSGGMGEVFEGVHKILQRRVAIKVLHPSLLGDHSLLTRFLNEARALGALHHPNIVEILDVTAGGPDHMPFLVMEFLDGQSLSHRLKESGSLPESAVLPLAIQMARAVAAAHRTGIIHRDLKPENIMLLIDGSEGWRLKVIDFGIAKLSAQHYLPGQTQVKTEQGAIMGTPSFMAPEQVVDAASVSASADVYSLGAILYYMMSGAPPCGLDNLVQIVAYHLAKREPTPLGQLAPGVSAGMARLVHGMLSQESSARPNIEQVLAQLQTLSSKSALITTEWAIKTTHEKPFAPFAEVYKIESNTIFCMMHGGNCADLASTFYNHIKPITDSGDMNLATDGRQFYCNIVDDSGRSRSMSSWECRLVTALLKADIILQGKGIGADCTFGIICEGILSVAHVGNTRLARVANGKLLWLTHEHNYFDWNDKIIITSLLGERKNTLANPHRLDVDVRQERVKSGDLFLLCSSEAFCSDRPGCDQRLLTDEQIVRVIQQEAGDIDRIAACLTSAVKPCTIALLSNL